MDIRGHIYIHIRENIQPCKSLPLTTTGMKLEDIMLNKTSNTKREILHDPHTCEIQNRQVHRSGE